MPRWRKAFALSCSEWFLILHAAIWFFIVEIGLRVFPFGAFIEKLDKERIGRRSLSVSFDDAARIAHFVELASRFDLLQPTCLKKALVLYVLLIRKGLDAQLWIGAAKLKAQHGNVIDYHAWLEHRGRIILGSRNGEYYIPLYCVHGSQGEPCTQGQPGA
jgi:Transglutaminase-like superfamily